MACSLEYSSLLRAEDVRELGQIVVKLTPPALFSEIMGIDRFADLRSALNNVIDKTSRGIDLDLSDALSLMNVALALRPDGPVIHKKVRQYQALIADL